MSLSGCDAAGSGRAPFVSRETVHGAGTELNSPSVKARKPHAYGPSICHCFVHGIGCGPPIATCLSNRYSSGMRDVAWWRFDENGVSGYFSGGIRLMSVPGYRDDKMQRNLALSRHVRGKSLRSDFNRNADQWWNPASVSFLTCSHLIHSGRVHEDGVCHATVLRAMSTASCDPVGHL